MLRQLSPGMLPIAKYQAQIMQLIDSARVVVISGKTGCGKSTQVPQFILKKHPEAKVIICQPRRVAATSLAVRVSEEVGCKLGSKVGYHIGMQTFRDQKCSIIYMTYGILIQQLLFMQNLPYTHIILDEIHQRNLEMDFTFVALKKIMNAKYRQRIKLVVMSATLNADLFCDYFCTNDEGDFYMTELRESQQPIQQARRGRGRQQEHIGQHFQVVPPGPQFKPALRLQLQNEKMFNVEQYFLDELNQNDFYYGDEEQRITEEMLIFAVRLIKKLRSNSSNTEGDYLVFLPGLFEIKAMKTLLMKEELKQQQIIEVHSLYSDELYHSLFDSNIKDKIILATNIGQSSITLPFCRVVIDFCLTRKNHSKDRGVTRLQTRLASQASLTQRSGRVGRVSDGSVYRMVTRQLYQKLPHYQKPEIQCVSLEMVILRAKQLDLSNNNEVFRNPYYFLMSTINPPNLQDIRNSLQLLIQEEALAGQQATGVRKAEGLFLTEMGKFMVEMPCQLRISKMVLMGLRLRIPEKIIGIASVLMLTKQFFLHQEKRYNIEEFMHALVGYDRGHFNDYLLRYGLFSHWREEFYEKAKEKKLFRRIKYLGKDEKATQREIFQRIYESEEGAEEVLSFLEEFSQEKWTEKEKEWCAIRGVSPNTMRELIRIEENLKLRICAKNFKLLEKEHNSNELILLCLEYGFPDNDCDVRWPDLTRQISHNPKDSPYYIDLPNVPETDNNFLEEYIRPQKNYKIEQKNQNKTKRIYGNTSILSKFLLPKHYNKADNKNTSELYLYLSKTKTNHHFTSEITFKFRPITLLNESICKACIPFAPGSRFKLLTHKFTEMGTKKMTHMGALIEEETYFVMQLILRKNIQLILHLFGQYFSGFRVQNNTQHIATALYEEDIATILHFRGLVSQGKQGKVKSSEEMLTIEDVHKLVRFLRGDDSYTSDHEVWQYRYQIEVKGQCRDRCFPINDLPSLNPKSTDPQLYKEWKQKVYSEFYDNYRPLLIDSIILICRKCQPHLIVQIQQISAYDHVQKTLKLNEYSGSWNIQEKNLTCKHGHPIGRVLNDDEASIDPKTLLLYIPYRHIEQLWDSKSWKSQKEIEEIIAIGKAELNHAKQRFHQEECIFCFEYAHSTGEPIYKRFDKEELGNNYLKKYMEHMRSAQHLNNVSAFRKNINIGEAKS